MNKPDGSSLTGCNSYSAPGGQCDVASLPTTGTYTVLVDPASTNAASLTLTLSNDLTGSLTVNGSALTFSTARVGQNARYTFSGTAGQSYSVLWTGNTFPGNYTSIYIYKPDGSYLTSTSINETSLANGTLDLVNLAVTGTYTVFVNPYGTGTGQVAVSIKGDATGTLAIDGAVSNLTLAAGQNARYTFSGTAGQRLGLGISALTTTPSGGYVTVTVYKPDGTTLTGCNSYSAPGGQCDVASLPTTGTYTVLVDPAAVYAANVTLTLSNDLTGSLTVNGSALTFSTTRVGQNARYTFSATSGQNYKVLWSGNTFAGNYSSIYVYKPDGSYLTSVSINETSLASGTLNLGSLPTTGTYTVFVNPYQTSTGQVAVQVTNP